MFYVRSINSSSKLNKLLRSNPKSTGGWNKHKTRQMVKENQSLVVTDKCLTRTPDVRVKLLENV
jgi:hypothetical protein